MIFRPMVEYIPPYKASITFTIFTAIAGLYIGFSTKVQRIRDLKGSELSVFRGVKMQGGRLRDVRTVP
ncbi:hypothetical protein BST96_02655 [Oceanicoccus sagamiensis]|uniref:Uncharacterized protein n=1 Tax=Oceanicoccus sagamiensis TaxID=716816 RepID=A0A1X9N7C4_9GAMM|nr:hypothetical protein BST96_02655 [Oceanicoccus sagamiensis]